jgi:flavin-dependent dehydrogenase
LVINTHELIVAGGGPAGISAAVKLHRLGFDVLLITAGASSNTPELQSLSPGLLTLAGAIGFDPERIYKRLMPVFKSRRLWSSVVEEGDFGSGFLTHRPCFENELLMMAEELGVKLMKATKIIDCQRLGDQWELKINQKGSYGTLKAKFLVDATGKKSIIRGKKNRVATSTLAITGCWKNTACPKASTQLESASNCWLWGARSQDDLFYGTLFLDPVEISGRTKIREQYIHALKKTKLFKDCLAGSLVTKITAVDVTPYYYEIPAGYDFIKLGESNVGFDPISSQGVQHAISNAIQAAIVVNTLYTDSSNAETALEFYVSCQQQSIQRHLVNTANSYLSASHWQDRPFWKNRIKETLPAPHVLSSESGHWDPDTVIQVSSDTEFKSVACISGDLVIRKTGIVHPDLDEPIVYYSNFDAAKMVESIRGKLSVSGIINNWAELMSRENAAQLLNKFKQLGILEAAR